VKTNTELNLAQLDAGLIPAIAFPSQLAKARGNSFGSAAGIATSAGSMSPYRHTFGRFLKVNKELIGAMHGFQLEKQTAFPVIIL
jgi:hypothetical protein